jgi:hypothetical protein
MVKKTLPRRGYDVPRRQIIINDWWDPNTFFWRALPYICLIVILATIPLHVQTTIPTILPVVLLPMVSDIPYRILVKMRNIIRMGRGEL